MGDDIRRKYGTIFLYKSFRCFDVLIEDKNNILT